MELPKDINFPLCLAPMVGLSHCAFRQVVREYLPKGATTLWPSEMLNSRRIPHENLSRIPESMKMEDENFWMPQLLANEEDKIKMSLEKLFAYGAQGVDINMGCPVKKALKHNYGVALMGDPQYAAEVVATAVRYSEGRPISVKLRAADQGEDDKWVHFVKALEEAGAHWLCLHPRTAAQKRRGLADWSQVKKLKELVRLPVIGNGDIQVVEDIEWSFQQSQCDMVMIGRALTARPWLLWQWGEKKGWNPPEGKEGLLAPKTPEEEAIEYGKSLFRLLDLMEEKFQERAALRKFLFHIQVSHVWLPFGHTLYGQISMAKTFDHARGLLDKFFSSSHTMRARTELRE